MSDRLEKLCLEAIVTASHDGRLRWFASAYKKAVAEREDGWALLCRGYEMWLREEYGYLTNEVLCEIAKSCPNAGDTAPATYNALRALLQAHVLRRYVEKSRQDGAFPAGSLFCQSEDDDTLKEAERLYGKFAGNSALPAEIRAVAQHSLGNCSWFRMRMCESPVAANGCQGCQGRDARREQVLADAHTQYEESAHLAEERGVRYAPPNCKLAFCLLREAHADFARGGKRSASLCTRALDFTEKAVRIAREQHPESTSGDYAPPFGIRARILYEQPRLGGPSRVWPEILGALKTSLELAPFDEEARELCRELCDDKECRSALSRSDLLRLSVGYPVEATRKRLESYFLRASDASLQNELIVLRHWSSFSPALRSIEHETVGGGYLLVWNGYRIAIDPGFGFIRNMHELGLAAHEINAVVLTHQHADHTADFEALLGIFKSRAKELHGQNKGQRHVDLVLSRSGCERWESTLLEEDYILYNRTLLCAVPRSMCGLCAFPGGCPETVDLGPGIQITATRLLGHQDALDEASGRAPTGFGLTIRLEGAGRRVTVGLTSDTGYVDEDGSCVSEHFGECDVVVAHVSTARDLLETLASDDFIAPRRQPEFSLDGFPGQFYKKHLGFWGTAQFVSDLARCGKHANRIVLLSELGEEFLGSASELRGQLQKSVASPNCEEGRLLAANIHLADVGTRVNLDGPHLMCQAGGSACQESADVCVEADTQCGNRELYHRFWSDRRVLYLCKHHAASADPGRRGRWPLIGDGHYAAFRRLDP